jgi:hypothetical protein
MTKPTVSTPFDLPLDFKRLLEKNVLHLWDEKYPAPDLTPLGEWLEVEGWDEVVSGLYSSCIYSNTVMTDLNDETLMEHMDIVKRKEIKNSDRISFARNHIEYLLSGSMDSIHSISIEFNDMPPAELCFTMYYHGQGGAMFGDFELCHSTEEFIKEFDGDLITSPADLSDLQILDLWKKSEAQLKSWRKSLS